MVAPKGHRTGNVIFALVVKVSVFNTVACRCAILQETVERAHCVQRSEINNTVDQ